MKLLLKLKSFFTTLFFITWTFAGCLNGILWAIFIRNRRGEDIGLRFWARVCMWSLGIRVKVEGLENIPDRGALYLFNHTSFLDIPIVFSIIERPLRFGAKIELFKVPILGGYLKMMRYLPISRGRREEVIEVYNAAAKRFEQGEGFILAPEGTRQKKEEIAEFKSGPFIFGLNAQVPLVPVVICGASAMMPKKTFLINSNAWISEIKVKILPPFETKGYGFEDRREVAEKVREQMKQALTELQNS